MRIVGGDLKGRVLIAPEGRDVRPTSDRAREAVFNILLNGKPDVDFDGITVLDVFAGSGALGLEALSRGADQAVFIESNRTAIDSIRENVTTFRVAEHCLVLNHDALHIGTKPFSMLGTADLVFLDPPYNKDLIDPAIANLQKHNWLSDNAVLVVETEASLEIEAPEGFEIIDARKYGAARVVFLRKL